MVIASNFATDIARISPLQRFHLGAWILVIAAGCNTATPEASKGDSSQGQSPPSVTSGNSLTSGSSLASGNTNESPNPSGGIFMRPDADAGLNDRQNGAPGQTEAIGGGTAAQPPPIEPPAAPDSGIRIVSASPENEVNSKEADAAKSAMLERVANRPFMLLTPPVSDSSTELFNFFADCDRSIGDLAMALRTQDVDEAFFIEQARRLSNMKLQAAVHLYNSKTLTPAEKKKAIAAQVEALSHLTGSGDIQAAHRLQLLAKELSTSSDAELAHQGKLVLLGFRLNQLQEGQIKDPQALLADIDQLFASSRERGPVEFMALDRCAGVLKLLGYEQPSQQVLAILVREFSSSPNTDLAIRAWNIETEGSEQRIALDESITATLNGNLRDPNTVAVAATNLLNRFPSPNSLWYLAQSAINLEFSGNVAAANGVFKVIDHAWSKLAASPLMTEVNSVVDNYNRRVGALGKELVLDQLAMLDRKKLDWNSYRGKVVLVCFWSSLNMRCLDEINKLQTLHQEVGDSQFEILSVNLDDPALNNVEQMAARQNYPWQTVRSSNPTEYGFATPAARSIGATNVPFIMLVNRSGIVQAIHPQGEKRLAMIRELLMAK